MVELNAEIIPYVTIGNIIVGYNIVNYTNQIRENYNLISETFTLPDSTKRVVYKLENAIKITTLSNGRITAVGCNENYQGFYKSNKGKIFPGLSMVDLVKYTCRQRIFNGSLIIDNEFGLALTLPTPYDEIADSIKDIPHHLVFNEIYDADFSSWSPKI